VCRYVKNGLNAREQTHRIWDPISTHLRGRTAPFYIDPESGYIDQQTDKGYGKELDLQMGAQDLQQQFDFGFQEAANHYELGDGLLLLLLLTTGHYMFFLVIDD